MTEITQLKDPFVDTRAGDAPKAIVSVLMPTFKQAHFISKALESLRSQELADWQLIIVDDGSPDHTGEIVKPYLVDARIRYYRFEQNRGLGEALNFATSMASGRYIAYLPSDDTYYTDHLARLVNYLEEHPDVYLAYGGLLWGKELAYVRSPTLQGEAAVGNEAAVVEDLVSLKQRAALWYNILALVQVMHRRDEESQARWATRSEVVSDNLEADYWRALLTRGHKFGYVGDITCNWLEHPDQCHKIVGDKTDDLPATLRATSGRGLSAYRQYYGVGRGQWLNWQPSSGIMIDERSVYGRLAVERQLPTPGGLKILLVGELGWNPERILAFEERGHKLYGLWITSPEVWDTAGPLPYGNVEDIAYDTHWIERVRAVRPDVIYALLNWQAITLISEVLDARLGIPLVFHFKEGPTFCQKHGLWSALMRILRESDGRIFISQENLDWFQQATDKQIDLNTTFILDGDLPKLDWMTERWATKLSEQDGEIHTVCAGRPIGMDDFQALADARINVHFYGNVFHKWYAAWTDAGLDTGLLHIHPTTQSHTWVEELSQYDAAWCHIFDSNNRGDLRRATWDDLNLPARLGTYAAAGLPWILKDNPGSAVTVQRIAQDHNIGVCYSDVANLAHQLRDRSKLAELTANMRTARLTFAFDNHVDALIEFFRRIIKGTV